jgi:hypothetical protein
VGTEDGYDAALRAEWEQSLPELETHFAATRNPIYAWMAIGLLTSFNSAQRRRHEPLPPLEWPGWVYGYIGPSAIHIMALLDSDRDNVAKADSVAAKLGLVRPGWNAFDAMERLGEAAAMRDLFLNLRDKGHSFDAAISGVKDEFKLESARAVQRRVAAVRRLFGDETKGVSSVANAPPPPAKP